MASKSGQDLINEVTSAITAKCVGLGVSLTADLTGDQAKLNSISKAVDQKNETWNENLPTRPTS